ncbi:MAG: GntR family transcriptional regulator [Bacillota bacterium]
MRSSLFVQTKQKLLNMINNREALTRGNQLAPEDVLSEKLRISRTTTRDVLSSLDIEGVISKKHGLGNFVHFSAIERAMRIDKARDFAELIELGGYEASSEVDLSSFGQRRVSDDTAVRLGLEPGDSLFYFECIFYASSRPSIHCHIYVPQHKLKVLPAKQTEKTIYKFLKKYCDEEVTHTIVSFHPINSNEALSKLFNLEPGTALLSWQQIYYNLFDEIICYSESYFNPEIIQTSMLRKHCEV